MTMSPPLPQYNVQDPVFCALFPELVELHGKEVARAAAEGPKEGEAAAPPPTKTLAAQPQGVLTFKNAFFLAVALFCLYKTLWNNEDA